MSQTAKQTIHVHNGIRYNVNVEGRCDWYSCTHNVYNSFDEPEQVIVIDLTTEGNQR